MIAGFFLKRVSATGAKASLFVGLAFFLYLIYVYFKIGYSLRSYLGYRVLLNVATMFAVSYFYPADKSFTLQDLHFVDMHEWKYTKHLSIFLCVATLLIYILLGRN